MASAADDIQSLLHIVSTNTSIQIPRGKFKKYLQDKLGHNPDAEIAKYKKDYFTPRQTVLKDIDLQISPLSIGLFNATIDTKSAIDIRAILEKVKEIGLVSEGGIKVTEMVIRYGKFKTALKYTSEYGQIGNASKPFVSADFKVKVTHGGQTKGASFSYYKTGKIRFSGGYLEDDLHKQPNQLIDFFSKHYHKIPSTHQTILNNVTAEFKVGFPLKTSLIFDAFSDVELSRFGEYDVIAKYNEKKFLYITFSKGRDKFAIIIADTGVVQIQGTAYVKDAYKILVKFFEALKNNDLMKIRGVQNTNLVKPKQTKAAKRFDNLPAPNITRRGTTCPLARRPTPYSYTGTCTQTACYIKPNPQGQPCCYSNPKSVEYSRNKVANAYKKAGVKVPQAVRTLFGIGLTTNNRPNNVANKSVRLNVRAYVNNKSVFKIDTRQCLRYTKVALVDMATRLKVVLPSKLTKPILCDLIKKASQIPNVNVKASGKVVTGTNKGLRLGSRMCETYDRKTLVKFARALGGVIPATHDKAAICKLIEQLSATKRTKLQTNCNRNKANKNKAEEARKKALANQKLRNEANLKKAEQNKRDELRAEKLAGNREITNKKARLTRNLVKEDLMGMLELNTVNNSNLDSLMNRINRAIKNGTIKKGKTGIPLKPSVNKVKKAFGMEMLRRMESPSPKKKVTKRVEPNSNENFNYFMKGPPK